MFSLVRKAFAERSAAGDDIDAMRLDTDRRMVVALCAVALVPLIGLAPMDAMITGGNRRAFAALVVLRMIWVVALLLGITGVRRATTRPRKRSYGVTVPGFRRSRCCLSPT